MLSLDEKKVRVCLYVKYRLPDVLTYINKGHKDTPSILRLEKQTKKEKEKMGTEVYTYGYCFITILW
jgi:hypothetical protein